MMIKTASEQRAFWRTFVFVGLLGIVALLAAPAVSRAQGGRDNAQEEPAGVSPTLPEEAAPEAYQSPLVIPAADFTSDGSNQPGDFFFSFPGGYLLGTDTVTTTCLQAPAYLPQGATVTGLFVSVLDNTDTGNIFLNLYRVDNFNAAANVVRMAEVVTSDVGSNPAIVTINDQTIVSPGVLYPNFSYYLGTCLDANVRLYAARIYYTE